MNIFKRKTNLESQQALLAAKENASRRYTYDEVVSIMAMLSGVAFDGLLIDEWEYEETAHWVKVEVTFTSSVYENWYFFKADEEAQV